MDKVFASSNVSFIPETQVKMEEFYPLSVYTCTVAHTMRNIIIVLEERR